VSGASRKARIVASLLRLFLSRKGVRTLFAIRIALASALIASLGLVNIPAAGAQTVTTVAQFKGGVGSNAVFNNTGFAEAAHSCTVKYPFSKFRNADQLRKNCLAAYMKAHGASRQAIAFMRYAPVPAAITQVRMYSSAAVVYAKMMWADASGGFALIGKSGQIVPIWEPPSFKEDPRYEACAKGHPELTLWATSVTWPVVRRLGGGGQTFIFTFAARTCHACANVCKVAVAYDFDYVGKFKRVRLFKVTPVPPTQENIYHPPAS
jgi:hypothetical protein